MNAVGDNDRPTRHCLTHNKLRCESIYIKKSVRSLVFTVDGRAVKSFVEPTLNLLSRLFDRRVLMGGVNHKH